MYVYLCIYETYRLAQRRDGDRHASVLLIVCVYMYIYLYVCKLTASRNVVMETGTPVSSL